MITNQQVKLLMNNLKTNTQEVSAAKVSIGIMVVSADTDLNNNHPTTPITLKISVL